MSSDWFLAVSGRAVASLGGAQSACYESHRPFHAPFSSIYFSLHAPHHLLLIHTYTRLRRRMGAASVEGRGERSKEPSSSKKKGWECTLQTKP